MVIDIYAMAREGQTDRVIALALGVTAATFSTWQKNKSIVRYALKQAREKQPTPANCTLPEFCEARLKAEHADVWRQVNEAANKRNGQERLNIIFAGGGIKLRKQLFLYALIRSTFNVSKACRKIGISRLTVDDWCRNDPDFVNACNVIHTIKREYFESALLKKVAEGDIQAIMLCNKTQNRKAGFLHDGYGDKLDVEVKGNVAHDHTHTHQFAIEDLDLPLDTRRVIVEAIRAKKLKEEEVTGMPQITQQ